MIISVVIGFFSGCFVVLFGAFLTDRIEAVTDLRDLGLNVLGTIPAHKKTETRADLATICLKNKFCRMVEVFSGINALISAEKYADSTKVLLINSSMPGEGKTISACNLAIASALNGAKTLLIDGDLRKPQLVGIFEIDDKHPSLLEWLKTEDPGITHERLVTQGAAENLDVITSRPVKDVNPAELLGRKQLAELIGWARRHYDRVIIDSPPLGPVGDAQVLVNHVDSVIMVSRVGKARRRALRFALSRYKEVDAVVLGCIANDVPHSLAGMFGGAEGYGYGYGYKSYKADD
jgi:capsular exopolysaccharide synthesis family protein